MNDRLSEHDDEQTILWIAFFVGLLPAAVALVRGADWTAEPTIGLLLCILAGAGLLARARKSARAARQGRSEGRED